jgi:hypothetical protein
MNPFRINLFRINPAYGLTNRTWGTWGTWGAWGLLFFIFSFVLVELVVLVHLVVLVVFLFFFSLCLQLVLLQRIVDIYVCILRKQLFVLTDVGATTWWFDLSETHFRKNASSNSKYLGSLI